VGNIERSTEVHERVCPVTDLASLGKSIGGQMTIVSLHMPKTAGTSFKMSLEAHFGERYRDDYGDLPISRPLQERLAQADSSGFALEQTGLGTVECVHGHFLPIKYRKLSEKQPLTFVTWLRDPATRILSHYNYWRESYDPLNSAPHHRRVIEEQWSVEKFCLSKEFRNIYSQYLWEFPLQNFAFVGISEHYREDLHYFSKSYLGTMIEPCCENVTPKGGSVSRVDKALLEKIRRFHAADCSLYEKALQLRSARMPHSRRSASFGSIAKSAAASG